ncbi:MAG: hypothetical protein J3K34DRAFT_523276 [Monoraphidium minutum]|nr:MAG: hypothetical protein J3K34DRAFT_523276 [Monoraphidium minutum]
MSRIYSAGQYELDYLPHRLGNWMPPDGAKQCATTSPGRFGTLRARPRGTRTQFVADARGHLLPGVPKVNNAFAGAGAHCPGAGAPPRWPAPSPALAAAPASTMGYKGITTAYLPTSTVVITTVELPGCRERAFQ